MMGRSAAAIVVVASLTVVASALIVAQATPESRIKAAIVSKFPQFVEWPAKALDGRPSIDICVVTQDPIESELSELVSGEKLEGRPIGVRRIDRDTQLDGCHLLFVRAGAIASHRTLLQKAASLPVLTVSVGQPVLEGIVQLRQVGGRMRFDVNASAAQKSGLRISSQLLQLALTVRGEPQ